MPVLLRNLQSHELHETRLISSFLLFIQAQAEAHFKSYIPTYNIQQSGKIFTPDPWLDLTSPCCWWYGSQASDPESQGSQFYTVLQEVEEVIKLKHRK